MTLYDLFGPIDATLGGQITEEIFIIEVILLALLLVNMAVRHLSHRQNLQQAKDGGADAIKRNPLLVATNILVVLTAFYYMTLHHEAGLMSSVLVLALPLTDIFEFESRKVEARRELDLDRPKASIGASVLALVYILYVTFLSGPIGAML
jgi:hypothetical protein